MSPLTQALFSRGVQGAPAKSMSLTAPSAPVASPPLATGLPLSLLLAQAKDDVPEPNQKNAQDFVRGMSMHPDYMQNLKERLLGKDKPKDK